MERENILKQNVVFINRVPYFITLFVRLKRKYYLTEIKYFFLLFYEIIYSSSQEHLVPIIRRAKNSVGSCRINHPCE